MYIFTFTCNIYTRINFLQDIYFDSYVYLISKYQILLLKYDFWVLFTTC